MKKRLIIYLGLFVALIATAILLNFNRLAEASYITGGAETDPIFSAWKTATPPIYSETDPQVGTLTNTKWCTTDGSAVNCTTDTPTFTNADTVDNQHLTYTAQSGQPTGLWGLNATGTSYPFNPSNFSVNYAGSCGSATSAGSAGSAGSATTANQLASTGYGSGTFTWYQTSGTFAGYSGGWANHLISNHGDGATYFNQVITMPFYSAPQYSRLQGGVLYGPYIFLSTENYSGYSAFSGTVTGSNLSGTNTGNQTLGTSGNNITLTNGGSITAPYAGSAGSATSAGTAAALSAQYIDWNAASGPTSIANKPTIPGDIYWNGTATNLVVATARTSLGLGTLATLNVAPTATALATNGANCTAGNYPLGVDASGAVETCTAVPTAGDIYWTGTATNLVAATGRTSLQLGSVALLNSITDADVPNNITIGYASTAGSATTAGSAGTATALAGNGTNCSAGSYPLGVDNNGNAETCTAASTFYVYYASYAGSATSATSATSASSATSATYLAGNGTNCSAGSYPLGVDNYGNAETCTVAGGGLSGGASGYMAKWTGASSLSYGIITDNGAAVGIGRSAPSSYTLDVNGSFSAGSINTSGTIFFGSTNNGALLSTSAGVLNIRSGSTSLRIDNNAGTANLFSLTNAGNVGIGMEPTYKLDVSGDIRASSFIYDSSDRNLKKNIATIKDPLDKIMKLRGVTFNWKKNNVPSVGLIAQEVEKVFPELVTGQEGNKAVAYNNLVAPLIEAVKAQQKEIEELRASQADLQLQILKLKN